MSNQTGGIDRVEEMIGRIVEGDLDATDAVANILEGEASDSVHGMTVDFDLSEDADDPQCPECSSDLEFGVTESEEGDIPTLYCESCDIGYQQVDEDDEDEEGEDFEDDDDDGDVVEGVLEDECLNCGSEDLQGGFVEADDEEVPVIVCETCDTTYVVEEED